MVILLPYFESDRLKNGSFITLKHLMLSCSVTAHPNTRQCLEEDQALTTLGQPNYL
jgi:hypothetical protein